MIRDLNIDVGAEIQLSKLQGGGFGLAGPLAVGPRGKVLWVDSNQAAAGSGTRKNPFSTVVEALRNLSDADKLGNLIVVAASHSETITAAAGWTLNKQNTTIVGLGDGSNRPAINFTTSASASILMSAAGCRLLNLHFTLTGIDALTQPIDVQAASCVIAGCSFAGGNGTNQPTRAILTNASVIRLQVIGNSFISPSTDTGGTDAFITIVGGSNIVIRDNFMSALFGAAIGGIECKTTLTTACLIQANTIINRTASNTKAITMLTGSTGMIRDNRMQILSGTAPITGDAMTWAGGNYYANALATAGTLI